MPGGGVMTLSADVAQVGRDDNAVAGLEPGPYVRISVSDAGVGMDDDTLAQSIEPFFTTKGPGKGTGLGLSMAKAFAEQSSGALTIESEPHAGTTIRLWFRPVEAKTKAIPVRPGGLPMPVISSGACILVVDDDIIVRETMVAQLEDIGYRPLVASEGPEALRLIEAGERVDLLLGAEGPFLRKRTLAYYTQCHGSG